jgi:putative ABC transport system substrate-binding protein
VIARRNLLAAFGASALIAPLASFAQQQGKVWHIGVLETVSMAANAANFDAFRQGMRERGYVEGRNLIIDYRSADGRGERFAELATELGRVNTNGQACAILGGWKSPRRSTA